MTDEEVKVKQVYRILMGQPIWLKGDKFRLKNKVSYVVDYNRNLIYSDKLLTLSVKDTDFLEQGISGHVHLICFENVFGWFRIDLFEPVELV